MDFPIPAISPLRKKPNVVDKQTPAIRKALEFAANCVSEGFMYSQIMRYCVKIEAAIVSHATYYKAIPILTDLAIQYYRYKQIDWIAEELSHEQRLKLSTDAAYSKIRQADKCFVTMIGYYSQRILGVRIVSQTLPDSDLCNHQEIASQCLERVGVIDLLKELSDHAPISILTHDCDTKISLVLRDDGFKDVHEMFDPSHFFRSLVKNLQKECPDAAPIASRIADFIKTLIYGSEYKDNLELKKAKWQEIPDHYNSLTYPEDLKWNKEKAIEQLKRFVTKHSQIVERVDSRYNTQSNESFNSLRCIYAPKQSNLSSSFTLRILFAVFQFNDPHIWFADFRKFAGLDPVPPATLEKLITWNKYALAAKKVSRLPEVMVARSSNRINRLLCRCKLPVVGPAHKRRDEPTHLPSNDELIQRQPEDLITSLSFLNNMPESDVFKLIPIQFLKALSLQQLNQLRRRLLNVVRSVDSNPLLGEEQKEQERRALLEREVAAFKDVRTIITTMLPPEISARPYIEVDGYIEYLYSIYLNRYLASANSGIGDPCTLGIEAVKSSLAEQSRSSRLPSKEAAHGEAQTPKRRGRPPKKKQNEPTEDFVTRTLEGNYLEDDLEYIESLFRSTDNESDIITTSPLPSPPVQILNRREYELVSEKPNNPLFTCDPMVNTGQLLYDADHMETGDDEPDPDNPNGIEHELTPEEMSENITALLIAQHLEDEAPFSSVEELLADPASSDNILDAFTEIRQKAEQDLRRNQNRNTGEPSEESGQDNDEEEDCCIVPIYFGYELLSIQKAETFPDSHLKSVLNMMAHIYNLSQIFTFCPPDDNIHPPQIFGAYKLLYSMYHNDWKKKYSLLFRKEDKPESEMFKRFMHFARKAFCNETANFAKGSADIQIVYALEDAATMQTTINQFNVDCIYIEDAGECPSNEDIFLFGARVWTQHLFTDIAESPMHYIKILGRWLLMVFAHPVLFKDRKLDMYANLKDAHLCRTKDKLPLRYIIIQDAFKRDNFNERNWQFISDLAYIDKAHKCTRIVALLYENKPI